MIDNRDFRKFLLHRLPWDRLELELDVYELMLVKCTKTLSKY